MVSAVFVVLISLAIAGVLLYHLLGPREFWDYDTAEGFLSSLQRRRDRLVRALRDVEYEYELSTISDEEFHQLRRDLKRRAVVAMKELDRAREARMRRLARPRAVSPSLRRRIESLVKERKERS